MLKSPSPRVRRVFDYTFVPFTRAFHQCNTVYNKNPFLYSGDIGTLEERINDHILNHNEKVKTETVIEAFQALKHLQVKTYEYDKFWNDPTNIKINEEMKRILESKAVDFNEELLKKLFLMRFASKTNVDIIKSFYDQNPEACIDKDIAMIPFRFCLFNGDLKNALLITDLTTGHPNYVRKKQKEFKSGALKLALTAIGVTLFSKWGLNELIEWGFLSETWRHLSAVNSMVLTYILNSSFFVSIVRLGRMVAAAGGDYLEWQKGTFYTHWYKHADEMLMCSKIIEADIGLNGGGPSGAEPSKELMEELCRQPDDVDEGHALKPGFNRGGKKVRLLEQKDNLEDLKMQAYWMTGGDGFEWVEPDQDPAIIIWKNHMATFEKPSLKDSSIKSLKWADDLIDK